MTVQFVEPEPRIAVKIVNGRFVTCYPMHEPEKRTFNQHVPSVRAPKYADIPSVEFLLEGQ